MIYLWRIPNDYPQENIGYYQSKTSPNRLLFQQGKLLPLNIEVPQFRFDINASTLADFDVLPNNAGVPLVSGRVADRMNQLCSNDFQLFECAIHFRDLISSSFFAINILTLEPCIDKNRSKFTTILDSSQILGFEAIRIKPSCMETRWIVREASYTPFILVNEALKAEFGLNHWKGCTFVDPETL